MGHGDREKTGRSRSPVHPAGSEDLLALGEPALAFPRPGSGHGGGGGGGGIDQVGFDAMFAQSLRSHTSDLVAAVQTPIETIVRDVSRKAYEVLDERLGGVEKGLESVEKGMQEVQRAQEKAAKEMVDFKAEILAKLDGGPGSQNKDSGTFSMSGQFNGNPCDTPSVTNTGFFRSLDPTMLFCNVEDHIKVSRPKFHSAILALALEAGLDAESFDLQGDPLDDRFEIKFKGDARKKCHQFFSSLQLGRGKWKKQVVLNDLNQEIRFFVGPDKNAAQIQREVLSKILRDIVQPKIQGKQVWLQKVTGTLFVDRRKLCIVHVISEDATRLEWIHTKRIELGLDEGPISEEFKSAVASRDGSRS